jgi:hypothetical protein
MTHVHQEHLHSARQGSFRDPATRPGFASTAAYFESMARKERRDEERRKRLMETAGFYRHLAGIIPAMPTGYAGNRTTLPLTRAERWKARAEECRTLADCFTDPTCRGQLARLAQSYEEMAVAAE